MFFSVKMGNHLQSLIAELWSEAERQLRDEALNRMRADEQRGVYWCQPDLSVDHDVSYGAIFARYKLLVEEQMVDPLRPIPIKEVTDSKGRVIEFYTEKPGKY